ncbi:hypothetical protein RFI_37324 [Reticulomyxa filosa]|uniref:Uncharacterized protein n=1 Tax=Reticulomyxa filosa TaxID=46433 RepID=X6LHD0_RETFI|nr:hypothetical protein RFI_37324 [Reticulomyxa filosa]|eukprot:ETO00135.1 hypothetical protein RFI_37324 [Reticulomyxa filosa]
MKKLFYLWFAYSFLLYVGKSGIRGKNIFEKDFEKNWEKKLGKKLEKNIMKKIVKKKLEILFRKNEKIKKKWKLEKKEKN